MLARFWKTEESRRALFQIFVVGSHLGNGGREQHAAFMERIFGGSSHIFWLAMVFGPERGGCE